MIREKYEKMIRHIDDLPHYTPPGHRGTHNVQLVEGSDTGAYEMILGHMNADGGSERHNHNENHQVIYILEGEAVIELGSAPPRRCKAGSVIRIPPGIEHRIVAGEGGDLRFIVVYSPPLKQGRVDDDTFMEDESFIKIKSQMAADGFIAGELTFGDCIALAEKAGVSAGTVAVAEAMVVANMSADAVALRLFDVFSHNCGALDEGRTNGKSNLLGRVGAKLAEPAAQAVFGDRLLDKALAYTLAAQVGNHCKGLQPCAGTGDACTYTGLMKAMREVWGDGPSVVRAIAVMLKIGTLFREGKSTTGCNMEGFGAGAAASAAAFTELASGSPSQVEHAVALALSPTIATPCTPRVMVPGLCATHIGGGLLIGRLASHLVLYTDIPVNVPGDIMLALAAAVHPISAETVVPEVVRHMAPFFHTRAEVEALVEDSYTVAEKLNCEELLTEARIRIQSLARKSRSILKPFGLPVAGGSSQAVGSPANTALLAHHLARGRILSVEIELAPELFARRTINVPAILAAAVFGAPPGDHQAQETVFEDIRRNHVAVTLNCVPEPKRQRIIVRAKMGDGAVTADNMGGARIRLREAVPDRAKALEIAAALGIEIVA